MFGTILHIIVVITVVSLGTTTLHSAVEPTPESGTPFDVLATPEAREILEEGTLIAKRDFEHARSMFIKHGPGLSTPNTEGFDRATMGVPVQLFRLDEAYNPERPITKQVSPRPHLSIPLLVDGQWGGEYQVQPSRDGVWGSSFGGGWLRRIENEILNFTEYFGTDNFKIFVLNVSDHDSGPWIVAYTATKEAVTTVNHRGELPVVESDIPN